MKSVLLTCQFCGDKKRVPVCREHLQHCSRKCYLESLKLDPGQVARMARMGLSRVDSAKTLGMPYRTFYAKLRRENLNSIFGR